MQSCCCISEMKLLQRRTVYVLNTSYILRLNVGQLPIKYVIVYAKGKSLEYLSLYFKVFLLDVNSLIPAVYFYSYDFSYVSS